MTSWAKAGFKIRSIQSENIWHQKKSATLTFLITLGSVWSLQISDHGWSVDRFALLALLTFSALAGWKFKKTGVSSSMGLTCAVVLVSQLIREEFFQVAIQKSARATLFVGAASLLFAVVRTLLDRLDFALGSDPLTGLLNLKQFKSIVEQKSAPNRNGKNKFAIALLDCDQFKSFNDTHGHLSGDQYLVDISGRIESSLEQGEFAARWGGDEFAILYFSTDKEYLVKRAASLQHSLSSPSNDIENSMTWSLGIAIFTSPEKSSADEKIHQADQAMYAAKRTGPGNIHLVSDSEPA